jgi:hypothetical protein
MSGVLDGYRMPSFTLLSTLPIQEIKIRSYCLVHGVIIIIIIINKNVM